MNMKKIMDKRWVRVLAWILLVLTLLLSSISAVLVRYGSDSGWYRLDDTAGFEETEACRQYIDNALWYVSENVLWKGDLSMDTLGSYAGKAFSYVIRDDSNRITADTRTDQSVFVSSVDRSLDEAANYDIDPEVTYPTDVTSFTVEGYVNLPVEPYDGCYTEYAMFETFFAFRNLFLAAKYLMLLVAVAALVFLCFASIQKGRAGDIPRFYRQPYDAVILAAILCGVIISAVRRLLIRGFFGLYARTLWITDYGVNYFLIRFLGALLIWYPFRQIGAGTLRKNLLLSRFPHKIPREAYILCGIGFHLLLLFLLIYDGSQWPVVLLLIGFDILLAIGGLIYLRQSRTVCQAAEELASGILTHKTDTRRLYFVWRALGDKLNRVGDGMAEAVEERMRSERLKTELITNVSHDLKTPLTSIVSYVDLLKIENLDEETRRAYIDVLDKQSARLKKLTEDVMEASKAASGAMTVHPETMDAAELLEQLLGEYGDRLKEARIEPVMTVRTEKSRIQADSVLLGRVLDNLAGNILKYSQPGTRAYFDLTGTDESVIISFKNTSREPLNITAEELMERFVRGDSSRHTEGSGLGLSIARSLTELMGGQLTLTLDGDLFKAELSFPVQDT